MKILIISEMGCGGPPWHGNRMRFRTILHELKEQNHELHFAGVNISDSERDSVLPFVSRCVFNFLPPTKNNFTHNFEYFLRLGCLFKLVPIFFNFRKNSLDQYMNFEWLYHAKALQANENYDAVIVEYIFHSAFLECFPDPCIRILDTHDVFAGRNQMLEQNKIPHLWFSTTKRAEKHGLKRANKIIAIQSKEALIFKNLLNNSRKIVTIGHLIYPKVLSWPLGGKLRIGYFGAKSLINLSGLSWFLQEVWSPLVEKNKNLSLVIGGGISEIVPESEDYRILGEFDSAKQFFSQVHITINPMLFGTGLKIKTIESLGYGRPVVGTSIACEGLENFVSKGIYLANSANKFIYQIEHLSKSIDDLDSIGAEATKQLLEQNNVERQRLRQLFN